MELFCETIDIGGPNPQLTILSHHCHCCITDVMHNAMNIGYLAKYPMFTNGLAVNKHPFTRAHSTLASWALRGVQQAARARARGGYTDRAPRTRWVQPERRPAARLPCCNCFLARPIRGCDLDRTIDLLWRLRLQRLYMERWRRCHLCRSSATWPTLLFICGTPRLPGARAAGEQAVGRWSPLLLPVNATV